MATRIKTVEYFLGSSNTTLAAATRRDLPQVAVRLPEPNKVFRSVRLILGVADAQATAFSLTSPVLGVQIDSVAFSNVTIGNPPANSGEHQTYIFERDVTGYFTTNFTGQQHNVGVGFQFTGGITINHTAKLIITYEYDDTGSEHVKTVRIPIESNTTGLTATLSNIGTNQIPALDTFLPEAGKVYRHVWIEAIYNDYAIGTANDPTLGISVAGGAEQLTGPHFTDLASARNGWYCFDQGTSPSWDTSTVQNIQARASTITTAATFHHIGFVLYITYTFNPLTSTRILNSLALILPPIFTPGATALADANIQNFELYVEEPGPITLRQSGAVISYSQTAAVTPRIKFGGQAERTYSEVSLLFCGASYIVHRVDGGAAQGAGITVDRGRNIFSFSVSLPTLGTSPSGFSGFLYVNYESDISSLGPGAHNQSVMFNVHDSQASGQQNIIAAAQRIFIPSPEWFRGNMGFWSNNFNLANTGTGYSMQIETESLVNELTGGGWENQAVMVNNGDGENGVYPLGMNVALQSPQDWDRWSGDADNTRMLQTASRRWRIITSASGTRPLVIWITMHNIVFTVASTISNSSGGTVTVNLHRASDGRRLKTTSRVGNGPVSFNWYDNTEDVYLEARETDELVGRSGNGLATGVP